MKSLLIIDYANLKSSVKQLRINIDLKLFLDYFKTNYDLFEARFYYGWDSRNFKSKNFLNSISKIGYVVISKPVKYIRIGLKEGRKLHPKCNFDVEITLDSILRLKKFNQLVLVSGDGDFVPLLGYFETINVRTIIYSTRRFVAGELINAAYKYVNIKKFVYGIQYKNKGKNPVWGS